MSKKAPKPSLCQAEVNVTFTPGRPGESGKWTLPLGPPRVPIGAGQISTVCYQLREPTPVDWGFKRIAICEINANNDPPQTDYIEFGKRCKPAIERHGLKVKVAFLPSPERIQVTFDGSLDEDSMTLGVLLGVSNGKEYHLSVDPQIILERDPPIIDHVATPRRSRNSR